MLIKYKLAPQTKFYDSMGANWKSFVMFNHFPNLRSKYCNTDINGLRFNNFKNENKIKSIFDEKKMENKKVGVIIGNSFAFGEGASCDQETISNLLSQSTNYHFYNLCGRGFSGFQEIINFLIHLNDIKKLDKILIISGCNDAFLPYYRDNYENINEPTHGYNLFKKTMHKTSRGWKNKTLEFFLGKFLKKVNWNKINSLNWKKELFNPENEISKNVPDKPNDHLKFMIENNFRTWSMISKGMNVDIKYILQPVGSWCKKNLSTEEKTLFSEENNYGSLRRIYKHTDSDKYNLMKTILLDSSKKYGLDFIDCNDYFSNPNFNNKWLFISRFHFNNLGNKYLCEYLTKRFFNEK